MQVKQFKTELGREYTIVNESFSNSRSWGHKSTLLLNDYEIATNRVTYLNRTWESYQYQTSMKLLVEKAIKQAIADQVDDYKSNNGKSRITKSERANIERDVKEHSELAQIYKQL